jgi:hypothetical protein
MQRHAAAPDFEDYAEKYEFATIVDSENDRGSTSRSPLLACSSLRGGALSESFVGDEKIGSVPPANAARAAAPRVAWKCM